VSIKLVDADGVEIDHLQEVLLKPGEVARILRVHPRTVRNWARDGKLASVYTMGGHRRFTEKVVRAALNGDIEGAREVTLVKGFVVD
jgi:excisionase family DNA binding protein